MLKKIINRVGSMCNAAYVILKLTLMLSGLLAAVALGAYAACGGLTVETYDAWQLSKELVGITQAILLIGILTSVCVEDFAVKS